MISQVVQADLTWTGDAFREGVSVAISDSGRIAAVGGDLQGPPLRLTGIALLPGLVNVHSHGFQRALRGAGEEAADGRGSFWSWREAMYDLVASLDADAVYHHSRTAFEEMLCAGYTSVGEFHYLHHDAAGDFALDHAVLRAAEDAGIRLVLIQTYYAAGGFGQPIEAGQRRFHTPDPEAFWRVCDVVEDAMSAGQTLAVAAHSLRAVPVEVAAALRHEAGRRGLVFHMHLEEQPDEIEACRAVHGAAPMDLVLDRLNVDTGFVAVHCTHSSPAGLARYLAAGGSVCVCPTTEGSLADGLPPLLGAGVESIPTSQVCVGSDSNLRISGSEELRWLEYGQRLRTGERAAFRDDAGVGAGLLRVGTEAGARALGLPAGRIAPGSLADFALLDLHHPTLAGVEPRGLAAAWLFGGGNAAVAGTCVGGRWRHTGAHAPTGFGGPVAD